MPSWSKENTSFDNFRLSKSRLQLDFIPDELPAIHDNTVHKVVLTLLPDTVLQDIANLVDTHRKVILKRTNRHLRQCMQSVTIDRTLYFDLDQEFVNTVFRCDCLHWTGHVDCSEAYAPQVIF